MNINKKNIYNHHNNICYAQGFQIKTHIDYTIVRIQLPWDKHLFYEYFLIPKSKSIISVPSKGILIRTPLKQVVCFSSAICGIFNMLGVLNTLIGVIDPQYINLSIVTKKVNSGLIQNIGLLTNFDKEKLMNVNPKAIFVDCIDTNIRMLQKLHIPIIYCPSYMENHPLGQAEWIRFIGLLFEKQQLADSLFLKIVHMYSKLKKMTENVTFRPTVFTEMKYGSIWYMPGGRSYLARILHDAGANYILKNNLNTGSVPLSFEFVLNKARKANYWLIKYYNFQNLTYKQLAKEYINYTLFDAYKRKNIYACNTLKVPYYQALLLHPDCLLREMINLFHPELMSNYVPKYYNKLQ